MKHQLIASLLLAVLMPFFCVSALFHSFSWIPEAQGSQDLGLRLVGTAVTSDPTKNFAIIENRSTGNQIACREGDPLGEVVIKKILDGQVVIGTKTGDQMLSMEYGKRSEGDVQSPLEMARLSRKQVDSTLPEYMQLMQEIRVRPYLEEGQPGGFLIYNIEPGSIFAQMGLENGDVIKAVNGKTVETTQQVIDFYDALKAGGTISLYIKRGESEQKLRFEIL
jgi:general secretion pathway protein C